ncbi:hypothetical protein [Bacillus taeanensis]|uniref:Extracellular protein n=1 Tax=Bacillus taeanensis TaxID=273032 RepID=A0A366Y3F9_9BACI|nr:hypothetical protein [Bacillus taeanensis]RBW71539.1 hypothetical protein DS031_01965 [Bacillus taeanensis]
MRKFILAIITLVISVTCLQEQVYAYSYGDPNEEEAAEVYKEMLIKLNETPPNYKDAGAIFDTIKEELDMHMGTEPAKAVITHLENEDKEAVIRDMEKILVLNISRRLENIDKNFEEYDTSKKLLAKAFATYKALSPVVEEKSSDANQKINDAFETALESLGNPGLFGVGEKESNYNGFMENKDLILTTLKDLFNMKSVEVGHFTEEDFEASETYKNETWTDFSNLKNWIPLVLLLGAIAAVVMYVKRKNR